MLKAIETRHNGYRFRSRLEARWAVFMDMLGVKYEYEHEGFELSNGLRYLPDFWLPGQQCWIEVKPDVPDAIEETKASELAAASAKPVFIVSRLEAPIRAKESDPVLNSHLGFIPASWLYPGHGALRIEYCCWVTCAGCGAISLAAPDDMWFAQRMAHGGYRECGHVELRANGKVIRAFDAARSARFEFNR